MANYSGDVGSYSHEDYTGLEVAWVNRAQGAASLTDIAHFASRNKVLVRAVHIFVRSACSAATGSAYVTRSGVTVGAVTLASATTVGTYHCITLTTLNTLATITEQMAIRMGAGVDKGEFDVCYEYQVLYPSTLIGA